MELYIEGKTKNVYKLGNGNFRLYFKDDVTGADGVFDPGANSVGLSIDGNGLAGLALSTHFFNILANKGIATHFISADLPARTMDVVYGKPFGKGLEVICRYKALGSFIRRYGDYIQVGAPLDALVEMTLKDDQRGDPLITEDALVALGVLSATEYDTLKQLTKEICGVIRDELSTKNLELCDIKLEFGRDGSGKIILIDEISGGNMRVLDNKTSLMPIELTKKVVGSY